LRTLKITWLFVLCTLMFSAGVCHAGFKVVGESKGFHYSIIWGTWFEVPLWVYVDNRQLLYMGGGSGLKATAVFPESMREEVIQLLEEGQADVELARETGTATRKDLGSIKMLVDEQLKHYNGIDVFLAKDRTGQSIDVYIRIYDLNNPQSVVEINLALDQLRDLIGILNQVPATIEFLIKEERMMINTNQLNLGKPPEEDRLNQINERRF